MQFRRLQPVGLKELSQQHTVWRDMKTTLSSFKKPLSTTVLLKPERSTTVMYHGTSLT